MTLRWAVSRGARIRYVIEGDQGPTLLFIHGLGGRLEAWRPVWRELQHHGTYRLIALDLRGFGESSRPPGMPGLDDFAEDVRSVLDDAGVERAVLVGSSMGGLVAIRTYTRYPRRVEALILSNTVPRVRVDLGLLEKAVKGDPTALKTIVGRVSRRLSESRVSLTGVFSGDPVYVRSVAERLMEEDVSMELAWVRVPVLVIAGDEDPVTPPHEVRRMASLAEKGVFRVVRGARHLSHLDNPGEYALLVHEFLAGLGPVGADNIA